MYLINYNFTRNRLLVKLSGSFTLEEMKICVDETIMEANKLKPGYDVITDITELKVSSPEIAAEIARVQAYFAASEARKGVRIVKKENIITGMQFNRTGATVDYNSVNVYSMAEAETILTNQN